MAFPAFLYYEERRKKSRKSVDTRGRCLLQNNCGGERHGVRRRSPNSLNREAVRMTRYERLVLCIMLAELIVNVLALLNKLL